MPEDHRSAKTAFEDELKAIVLDNNIPDVDKMGMITSVHTKYIGQILDAMFPLGEVQ